VSILSLTVKTKPQTRRSQHQPEGGRKTTLTLLRCCGGALHAIGESVSEMLDWVPAQLRVVRTEVLTDW
jgi:transposase